MLLNHFERLQSLPVFGCILIEQFLQFRVFESFWPSFTSTVINIEIIVFKGTEPITTRWSDVFTQLKVYDSTMKHVKTVCLPYVATWFMTFKICQNRPAIIPGATNTIMDFVVPKYLSFSWDQTYNEVQ